MGRRVVPEGYLVAAIVLVNCVKLLDVVLARADPELIVHTVVAGDHAASLREHLGVQQRPEGCQQVRVAVE